MANNFLNKKTVFLVLLLALLFALLPAGQARAQLGFVADLVAGLVTFLPAASISAVLLVAGHIAALLAAFGGVVLNWVLSPSFVQWSYTNPANNQLIELGLNITRPLANLLLVVFLVVIALSIALRIGEYGSKKTFVKLLVVALLINFSHVFAGLIVDAGNIVMNFFIQAITGGTHLTNTLGAIWQTIGGAISFSTFKITSQLDIVLQLVVIAVLNFALALVLQLWALIFALRYIMIWLLVILSPLAFAAWILPSKATQKIWNLWWNTFISWVIIGVNAVFFLYLADQFSILNPTMAPPGTLGGAILPAILPLVVYWAGFVITFAKLPSEMGFLKSSVKTGLAAAGVATVATAWAGLSRIPLPGGGETSIGQAHRDLRAGGATRLQALTGTAQLYWQRRTRPALSAPVTIAGRQIIPGGGGTLATITRAPFKLAEAASRGAIAACAAGGAAGLRRVFKMKRKGLKTCPTCGNPRIAASADFCRRCGHNFA